MSRARSETLRIVCALLCSLPWATAAVAQDEEEPGAAQGGWIDALARGRAWVRFRYRFEEVDQQGFDEDAHASTLRSVLGYRTAAWHGLVGTLEFENVTALGEDLYDSTTNGETSRPVVADPEDTEVNQVYLEADGSEGLAARLGRQVIALDDHRFVGDVGWRQNQQTFDALSVEWSGTDRTKVVYAFVDNVNRIFGDDSPQGDLRMSTHLLNAAFDGAELGKVVAHWYRLDFDDLVGASTSTLGLRYAGKVSLGGPWSLRATLAAAHQVEVGDNPTDVDAGYFLGELGVDRDTLGGTLGCEVLDGSLSRPGDKFTTPLATLHRFQGWADLFLATPDAGVEDVYVSLSGKHDRFDWAAVWHEFSAEAGSADYGSELDLLATWTVSRRVRVGLKLAAYEAQGFGADTRKAWAWLELTP